MEKIDKSDHLIRRAIWEIYNHRCFYSGDPLDYSDLQLDHIIPESIKNKPDDLVRIVTACGLPKDFELDSLYNLIPTNRYENNRKSNKEYEVGSLLHFLEIAKSNVAAIESRIRQLKKDRNFSEHISYIKAFYHDANDRKRQDAILEDIVCALDNSEDFTEQELEYKHNEELMYKKYTKRIGLEAIMPRYDRPETTCIIVFRNFKLSCCRLVLGNKTVLTDLFAGLYTDPKYGARGFLHFNSVLNQCQQSYNLDDAEVQISSNRLKLSSEDIQSFCEVIDSYATKYIKYIQDIENVLKSHHYPLSRGYNCYKLIEISYVEWRKLVKFAFEHDCDHGSSKWHIFDNNDYIVKVYNSKATSELLPGYHAFFYAEYDDDIVLHPDFGLNSLCITYEVLQDFEKVGIQYINSKETWDVEMAYDWLINKFIPKVLGRSWARRHRKREKYLRQFYSDDMFVYYLANIDCSNLNNLSNCVKHLQKHYHMHPNNKYWIPQKALQEMYNAIALCLENSKGVDIHYLCEKLHLHLCQSKTELIDTIEEISEQVANSTVSGFGVDLLLRGLLVSLDNNSLKLSQEDILLLRDKLDYFIEIHDREVLVEKYATDFVIG